MNESKFIASIYQEQKSNDVPQTIYQGFRKIDPISMYKNSLSTFPLYRVAAPDLKKIQKPVNRCYLLKNMSCITIKNNTSVIVKSHYFFRSFYAVISS